jgi:hypothetical protein
VAGFKINLQKSLAFLYTSNKQIEKKFMEPIPFTIASEKGKIHRIKLTEGCELPLQAELQTLEESY